MVFLSEMMGRVVILSRNSHQLVMKVNWWVRNTSDNQSKITNYAKQTQCPNYPNEHNLFYNKALRKFPASQTWKNKPNQTQFKAKTKPIAEMLKMNLTLYTKKVYKNFIPLRTMQNKPNFEQSPQPTEKTGQAAYTVGGFFWKNM